MQQAAAEIKNITDNPGTVADCTVSFDGSWQGHASHHGVVTSILVDSGKCVDVEVLSNVCKGCSYWEKNDQTTLEYTKWRLSHVCQINHQGSAAAMEPVGATRIFDRSETERGSRYTKYLGDGCWKID